MLPVLLLGPLEVSGQEIPTQPQFRIVLSGVRTKVGFTYSLNADCTSAGLPNVRILQKPRSGTVEILNEEGYTAYAKDAQQYKCNEKKTEMISYYYKSNEGFRGKDRFVVEVFFLSGQYRKLVVNVDVK
jgi:hypothetical protein